MCWFFASGGQSIGASALASVLPVNIQGWFPLGVTAFISLQSKGPSSVFCSTTTNTEKNTQCSAPAPQVRTWYLTAKLHLGPKAAWTAAWFSPPKAQRKIYKREPKEDIQMATEAMQRSSCSRERQIKLQWATTIYLLKRLTEPRGGEDVEQLEHGWGGNLEKTLEKNRAALS